MAKRYTFENGFFWNNYISIESEFLKFLEYAPYHEANLEMYSPKLTGLLLQIGGYVDSAFKDMADYFGMAAIAQKKKGGFKKVSKNKVIDDIRDAFTVWESIYNLSANNGGDLTALLDFGDKALHPYAKFTSPIYDESEWWWKAYNKVKHEYALHYQKANITNVLEGLAGAFLLNVVHYPSIKFLWQLEVLETVVKSGDGFAPYWVPKHTFDEMLERAVQKIKPLNAGIRVETSLFLYTRW